VFHSVSLGQRRARETLVPNHDEDTEHVQVASLKASMRKPNQSNY
jgi:hypothetical protein